METQVECLRLEGRRAVVQPEGPVARVSAKAVPALRGVEILVIPPDVDAFYGLNRFENLRIVEYGGTADVFAFQDSLDWLSEKLADEEAFLFRLATNAIGARPISPALTAIAAPRMRPIHAMVHWDCLMAALDERAANGTVRQDTSRENIFLCQGYAQLKRLEYAFYLGFSLEEEGYAPEIGACYRQEDRFTGEERLIYALALLRGHSYQEFYTNGGTNDFLVNFETTNGIEAKDEFAAYGKDVAMQVAAANPSYVDEAAVPAEVVAKEKEILLAQMANDPKNANKPDAVKQKMIEGKIKKYFKENCLVDQEFVKDGDMTVGQYTAKVAKDLGGEIKVIKFTHFVKGEGLEKRSDDFAAEVASMVK